MPGSQAAAECHTPEPTSSGMSTNKTLARKRARKNARRRERRGAAAHQGGRAQQRLAQCDHRGHGHDLAPVCVLCGAGCSHDGVLHESDCGHDWIICPTCAVRTCEDCISKPEIVARARVRNPEVEIGIDPIEVGRLSDKLSGVVAEVAEPMRPFMSAPVPCGTPCSGSMIYVEGSERWPSQPEQASMPDLMLAYDRTCTICGRQATSMLRGISFDDDLVDHELRA
jgi:hypothetical protein